MKLDLEKSLQMFHDTIPIGYSRLLSAGCKVFAWLHSKAGMERHCSVYSINNLIIYCSLLVSFDSL